MTQEELAAHIAQDIKRKGSASVPIGIIREAFFAGTRISPTIDAVLKEFASNHGWHIRPDDDLPTLRVVFNSVEAARKFSEKKGNKK